jgi:hypothetical protein
LALQKPRASGERDIGHMILDALQAFEDQSFFCIFEGQLQMLQRRNPL